MKSKETISCEEALKQVFEYIDHALDESDHCNIEDHLSKCRSCYSRVEFERRLKEHLHDIGKEKAPDSLEDKVHQILRQVSKEQ